MGRDSSAQPTDQWALDKNIESDAELDIEKDARAFFVGQASFEQHYDGQEKNRYKYAATLKVFDKNSIEVSQSKYITYSLLIK